MLQAFNLSKPFGERISRHQLTFCFVFYVYKMNFQNKLMFKGVVLLSFHLHYSWQVIICHLYLLLCLYFFRTIDLEQFYCNVPLSNFIYVSYPLGSLIFFLTWEIVIVISCGNFLPLLFQVFFLLLSVPPSPRTPIPCAIALAKLPLTQGCSLIFHVFSFLCMFHFS